MYQSTTVQNITFSLIFIIFATFSITAQNRVSLSSNKTSNRKPNKYVTVEENWNESKWVNFTKTISSFDSTTGCFEETVQKWNGKNWTNDTKKVSYYDALQYNNATMQYKWENNGWELVEGERLSIDTVLNNGNRLVLQNSSWNPQKKIWVTEDSIIYDLRGRILRMVNSKLETNDKTFDTVKIISVIDYLYPTENTWIEIQTTSRSDKKKIEKEQFRYRRSNDMAAQTYMIDFWDNGLNRWIPNTAILYRITDDSKSVYDSIEEVINNQLYPVYVSAEKYDSSGNLLLERILEKKFNENARTWSGSYYKWERTRSFPGNEYTTAESSFVLEPSGKNWVLTSYEKKSCRLPISGGYTESGNYENTFKTWEYYQVFDTLLKCGVLLNGENYCDIQKKRWIPLTGFSYTQTGDSMSIVKSYFNIDKNNWDNDSLFTLRLDSNGLVLSKTNHVWAQSGLFSGKWNKVSRIVYLKE